jgi:hypothetical protein
MLLLPLTVALSLLYTFTHAHPHSIWHISIDEGPAPPPDEGPPLSAHALRDKGKLPYEILGIFGAYLFWVAVSAVLILIVRRQQWRRQNISKRTFDQETLKSTTQVKEVPMNTGSDPTSPKPGARLTAWISPGKGHNHQASQTSISTVDERVVEADRAKNMDDMAALFAAALQQDEEKAQLARDHPPLMSPTQQPPELQDEQSVAQPSSQSIPTTPVEDDYQTMVASQASSRKAKSSPLSFLSSRASSANSNKSRPSRISFRGQPISRPIDSPGLTDSSVRTDEAPLTPRIYYPGPAPPTPVQKSAAAQAREAERGNFQRPQPPAALSLRSTAVTNSTDSLPFRQVYPESMKSAPATKTTFLEKRESVLHPAPMTGVSYVPYSPYEPYTPVTPISPQLATKQEVKRNKKKYGVVLTPDDVVPSDEDMWGKVM